MHIKPTREQRAIIKTQHPFVSVFAVAGSGKTSTLFARAQHLVSQGVVADRVLILSFSNKAVEVLRTRLRNTIPSGNIMTFHSLGMSLVQRQEEATRYGVKLATPKQGLKTLHRTVKTMRRTCTRLRQSVSIDLRTAKERTRLMKFFLATQRSTTLEQRLVADSDAGFTDYVEVLHDLRRIRRRYDRLLRDGGLIDYAGMLRRGRLALGDSPFPYTCVLVDEIQDMDQGQARLLRNIAERVSSIMVFGDPAQAIFGFMGGKFHDMREILGKVKVLPLSRSFRLTHETAALANAINTNCGVVVVGSRGGRKPAFVKCETAREQEATVVALVEQLKASGAAGDDIAVLARTKAQLRQIEQALLAASHMTHAVNGEEQPAHMDRMLDVLAMLNRNVERWQGRHSRTEKIWLERRLVFLCGARSLPKAVLQKCRRRFQKAALAPSFSGRYAAVKTLYVSLAGAANPDERKAALIELNRWQATSDRFRTVKSLRAFIHEMRQQSPVMSSTIHGAKGDEWDYVIIVGVTEGSLPFYRELKRGDVEEERRLFYVATTRAKKRAYLIEAPYHHAPSGQLFNKRSQFLTRDVRRTLQSFTLRWPQ
ncbi:hypothetical protein BWP39_09725 [Paraburkholderia acidicola]|uniref:DNA 3'-5' helicase n=2 Tax=Paraburkholderia acidicola TaxID=1912599 RepID=A0A2A4F3U2_9BURK|nr:hypothetical protein BWP39_09725 [Paraburkholderia acidicola]